MKRSEINAIMRDGAGFIRSFGFQLPPFAWLTPDEMRARRMEWAGIVDAGLGWDITDYGQERFAEIGLFLFTLRNGRLADLRRGRGMCYAEKLLISRRDQLSPMHRHIIKAEDIINRGGGLLAVELWASDGTGAIDRDAEVVVSCDGIPRRVPPGGVLRLGPGESVTLMPGDWHAFWAERADVLIGEVSTVNDDISDNVFAQPLGRFASIEEDEQPLHLLVSDYGSWLGSKNG
jgi:D-lyxose ketol-isomerase